MLQDSLSRLKATKVGLYQIHWPGFPFINNWSTDAFVEGMARVQRQGLADAVGVSNFNAKRLRRSHSIMQACPWPQLAQRLPLSCRWRDHALGGSACLGSCLCPRGHPQNCMGTTAHACCWEAAERQSIWQCTAGVGAGAQGSGVPLASDQVQYSLLYREPERNGVLDTCRELGITLIAYSPMCQGLLTGGASHIPCLFSHVHDSS